MGAIFLLDTLAIPLCFLQRFLCRSEKRWPGRVLPVGWFLMALGMVIVTVAWTWEVYTANPQFIPQWILEILFNLLLLNLPTILFCVVGRSVRENMERECRQREELEQMRRQDLE